jgi:hypothetical protein
MFWCEKPTSMHVRSECETILNVRIDIQRIKKCAIPKCGQAYKFWHSFGWRPKKVAHLTKVILHLTRFAHVLAYQHLSIQPIKLSVLVGYQFFPAISFNLWTFCCKRPTSMHVRSEYETILNVRIDTHRIKKVLWKHNSGYVWRFFFFKEKRKQRQWVCNQTSAHGPWCTRNIIAHAKAADY